jgi:hypothetical protein
VVNLLGSLSINTALQLITTNTTTSTLAMGA